MNKQKPQRPQQIVVGATGAFDADDRAAVDAHLAWWDAYQTDPRNRCECGGMIWRRWSVRSRHDEGAYRCKHCKTNHAEPPMWREREARGI